MDRKKTGVKPNFRFTFKPVERSQKLLIHRWVAQEHINEWLHGDGLSNTIEDLDNFLRGSSWNLF